MLSMEHIRNTIKTCMEGFRAMPQITSGNFTFTTTTLDGVIVIDVRSFDDERGSFFEVYKKEDFYKGGITADFVQDNQSSSVQGVLRGLHFQKEYPQSKLVRVVSGEVFDVAVDIRKESPTYGRWEGVILSSENKRQFFIPKGFAHGYLVLSDTAVFSYKCDEIYHPHDEGGVVWNDPVIDIQWPDIKRELIISKKDQNYPTLDGNVSYKKFLTL